MITARTPADRLQYLQAKLRTGATLSPEEARDVGRFLGLLRRRLPESPGAAALVRRLLDRVRCGDPVRWGPLAWVPLCDPGPSRLEIDLLAEAPALEVRETGRVHRLEVVNRGPRPVLILDGDLVCGGMQDRTVNTAVLVPAGRSLTVRVSCVERGRWDGRRRRAGFSPGKNHVPASIRHLLRESVSASLKRGREHESDQREVWDGVERLHRRARVTSPTEALDDVFPEAPPEIPPPAEGQCGLATRVPGLGLVVDLLAHPDLYRSVHGRLVRSHLVDAAGPGVEGDLREESRGLLRRLSRSPLEVHRAAGLGREVRAPGFQALVWRRQVVCLAGLGESGCS